MKWLQVMQIFFTLNALSANLIQVKSVENIRTISFVETLLKSFEMEDSTVTEVVMFCLKTLAGSMSQVIDLCDGIRQIIPDTMAVLSPRPNEVIENRNLHTASLIIYVTDIYDPVSGIIDMKIHFIDSFYSSELTF